jgi:hypothetical protein
LLLVGVSAAAEGLENLFPALRVFGDRKPRGLREREADFLGVLEADAQDAVDVEVVAEDPKRSFDLEEEGPEAIDPKRPPWSIFSEDGYDYRSDDQRQGNEGVCLARCSGPRKK